MYYYDNPEIIHDMINRDVDEWKKSGSPYLKERPFGMFYESYQEIRRLQNKEIQKKKSGVVVHTSVVMETDKWGRNKKLTRQNTYIKPKPKPKI